jgi:PAS domain S-box-containing protein
LRTLLVIVCLAITSIPIGIIGGMQGFQSEGLLLISLIFMVTFFVSITISYLITRPIERLTSNIDEISKGKLDVNLESSEISEINNLTDSLNRVMTSLKLAINKVGVKKGEIFEETAKVKENVEQKHDDLINSIAGWAWEIDAKGAYTFCSRNVSKLLGYTPQEMIGKSIFDFMISDNAKKTKSVFNESSKTKKPIRNLENWNFNKNSEKICVITNGLPFYNEEETLIGFRGVNTDITHEKIAYDTINSLNKELSDIKLEITELLNYRNDSKGLESIGLNNHQLDEKWSEHELDSVFLFDENANILDCNENMYKKLGYSKSEMLSLNISDIDVLESKNEIMKKIGHAKKNGFYSFKTIHQRKDGSAILVHENLQYLKDNDQFKCIVREDFSFK